MKMHLDHLHKPSSRKERYRRTDANEEHKRSPCPLTTLIALQLALRQSIWDS
jgi:hypothetical protein